jgi:hypothetical protein
MFKPRFARLVEAGTKRQTIRPLPKRMPKVGDPESWREWTGAPYRSPTREVARVELTGVSLINLGFGPGGFNSGAFEVKVQISKYYMLPKTLLEFAVADGFENISAMFQWFEAQHGLPFTGILITAKDLTEVNQANEEQNLVPSVAFCSNSL